MRQKILIRAVVSFLGLLLLIARSSAQNISNRGREFWVGYGHHQFMEPGQANSQEMVLYFSAEQAANVTVTIKGRGATLTKTYPVPANTVIASDLIPKAGPFDCRLYDLPPSFGGSGGEGLFDLSIHIESDVPIVAYSHTYGSASSGATMLFPVEAYGYQYYSLNSTQVYAPNCFSWAYVVAAFDNTVVEITPTVQTRMGKPAGSSFNVTLNKGQIYQVIGANLTGGSTSLELSGTKFRSIANASGDCYPVAVFSGSSRTSNPISCGSGGGDNDNQQSFPTQSWGKKYLTAPLSSSTAASTFQRNSFRVLVKDPATVVTRNGSPLTGLQRNSFYFFESNTADVISADKPIMVAQYMTGGACLNGGVGDPEMIYLSPVEQGIKRLGFYRNNREAIQVNYLTLIIPTSGITSLRIDGLSTFDHSYPHPNASGYSVVVKRWSAQAAQARVSSDSAFTAVTYGLGSVESYGYNAGAFINNLNVRSGLQNLPDTAAKVHAFTCVNTPVRLSALMASYKPTRIEWLFSRLGNLISPRYDTTIINPIPTDEVTVDGIKYWRYELPGTYRFSKADTVFVPIRTYHPSIENCYNREDLTIPVIVKVKPSADFSYSHTGCTRDSIFFRAKDTTLNGFAGRDYTWVMPDNRIVKKPQVDTLLPPGTYSIRFGVVTKDGCTNDTIRTITISDKPPAGFTTMPSSVCAGSSFQFKDTSSPGISVTKWYWNFGNGKDTVNTVGPLQEYIYPAPGKFTVKHVSSSSLTCVSDTVTQNITVFANPLPSFTNDANGCIASDGKVRFMAAATVSDGQAISAWLWNFGDAAATPANPNTASGKDTLHVYRSGSFLVKLTAQTVNGCKKDTVMMLTFKLRPALAFAALDSVCQSSAPVSVAKGSVTNGLAGTAIYKGTGTTAAGQFDPGAAGPGLHTIWFVFQTSDGCIDSLSRTIRVWARPTAAFSMPAPGCLPANGRVLFTNSTTISDNQSLSYVWNFGDANATTTNPNISALKDPTHDYVEGTFAITLTATTINGCSDDTTVQARFALRPVLTFTSLTAVCQESAVFSVAKGSVTNGVTGTGIYRGPGTSPNGQFDPKAAGYGNHTIWFVFTTSGGCSDSISQTIRVHATPVAAFSVPLGGCLEPGGRVSFSNTSSSSDLQTLSYLWNFGDPNSSVTNPNTSTLSSPTHDYVEGTYNVKLVVTTQYGCVNDSTIVLNLGLKPILTFGLLNPVCQDVTPFSIAKGSATNSVIGNGVYRGPGVSANGRFDPSLAGHGTHIVWFIFTTVGGCKDSISQTITVYPRPVASFTANAGVCVNRNVILTDASAIPSGTVVSWQWDLGDGSTPIRTSGAPFSHAYVTPGTYKVRLVAVSGLGCQSIPVENNVLVSPDPVASFSLPAAVCFPGNPLVLTNSSTVADNSGLSYEWDFGDGSPRNSSQNGSRVYTVAATYLIKLTATSGKGCIHSVSKTFNNFVSKPTASFTVSSKDVCEGVEIRFQDASNAMGSSLNGWAWNFGDGSTSSAKDPTKRYTIIGQFSVRLTVTNATGCVSDPFIDTLRVYLQPVVDAGPSFIVPQGSRVDFRPIVNDTTINFRWSPAPDITGPAVLRASIIARLEQVYRLTAVGKNGCSASDTLIVRILKPIEIPNVFSPNGDGIHDTWVIRNMSDYPGSTVNVFNRYGQLIHTADASTPPWNGSVNGALLPVGVYYYIIDLKNGFQKLSGSITIIR